MEWSPLYLVMCPGYSLHCLILIHYHEIYFWLVFAEHIIFHVFNTSVYFLKEATNETIILK